MKEFAMKVVMNIKIFVARILGGRFVGYIARTICRGKIRFRECLLTFPDSIGSAIFGKLYFGIYESAEIRFVNKYISNGLDTIELGSSVGVVSSIISKKKSNEVCQLVFVEPNIDNYKALVKNVEANSSPNSTTHMINKAVEYYKDDLVVVSDGKSNLTSKVVDSEGFDKVECNLNMRTINPIKSIRLSEILSKFSIENYNLVMDIEGAEIQVFQNDVSALCKCSLLIIELHSTVGEDGQQFSIDSIVALIESVTKLKMVERHFAVCVFM